MTPWADPLPVLTIAAHRLPSGGMIINVDTEIEGGMLPLNVMRELERAVPRVSRDGREPVYVLFDERLPRSEWVFVADLGGYPMSKPEGMDECLEPLKSEAPSKTLREENLRRAEVLLFGEPSGEGSEAGIVERQPLEQAKKPDPKVLAGYFQHGRGVDDDTWEMRLNSIKAPVGL